MLSLIGLVAGLGLLIVLTMRGMNLFIATPLCALLVALTGDLALLPQLAAKGQTDLVTAYMGGFSGFIGKWFLMFLLGSIFGKLMESVGAAESVARWVTRSLGPKRAALAVVLACAILTYGGVSLFVVAFSVYPMAISLFREADLPRRFIPAALAFGSVTFTMTSAGSPEIQNWIPIEYFGTSPMAGWQASAICAVFMFLLGSWWFKRILRKAAEAGEHFEPRDDDPVLQRDSLPHPLMAALPLLVVLVIAFLLHDQLKTSALILALLGGSIAAALLNLRHLHEPAKALAAGSTGALIAVGNTAAVVGFGAVASSLPAFRQIVEWVIGMPGNGLVSSAIAVSVIAGMTGSASGGQAIALPIIAPHFMGLGVNPEHMHRVVALASGALDALPHNGYVVTTIRAICGETHRRAYPALAILAAVVPTMGLILCLILFGLGL
jgi:H+/gluconate symporter-like permease